jgi:predicted RNase H-like HicB family nuclease
MSEEVTISRIGSSHGMQLASTDSFTSGWYGSVTRPIEKNFIFPPIMQTPYSLESAEEGGYIAKNSKYPGAVGQGETEEEAIRDLEEAIEAIEEELRDNP